MTRRYRVTVYNQHAQRGVTAEARTRREAFNLAIAKAGEPFLRHGGDKLTTLRVLFFDIAMPSNRTARHCYVSSPLGCAIEWRRLDA